ncbi:Hypothetical protein I5071_64680 [Sandaracinus amylolyticus]|nr:Hypothetical protein I5071_64680 [Sandaracinus amylolyticus]
MTPRLVQLRTPVRAGRVTLVRGPMQMAAGNHVTLACPPLGVASLAGALRAHDVPVTLVDAVGLDPFRVITRGGFLRVGIDDDAIAAAIPADTMLIGVSCMFSEEWPLVRATIEAIARRHPGVPIVLGGEHATALPEHALAACPHVAACALGEGEQTIIELAYAIAEGASLDTVPGLVIRAEGGPTRTTGRRRIADLTSIPRPAWDLVPMEAYLANGLGYGVDRGRSVPLLATRGCPYRCTFCSSPTMWTTKWSARSPDDVLDEMLDGVERYRARNFDFYDLTAVIRRDWILELCRKIVERGLRVTWQIPAGTRSEAIDHEVATWLRRAGCTNLAYAPESGSPAVLERVRKKISLDVMKRSMRDAVAAGLHVKANLIVGFPDETAAEAMQTVRFCRELARIGIDDVNVTPFCPYPGTEDFRALVAKGRIGPLDDAYFDALGCYSDLSASASWCEHMDERAIARFRWQAMAEFYGRSFVHRPRRVIDVARSVVTGRQETRLDKAVSDIVTRHPAGRRVVSAVRAVARRTRLASDISARDS